MDDLVAGDTPAYPEIDQWIRDHAYAPDDIVLGDGITSISDEWLTDLQVLLDLARPGWRDLFGGKS